MDGAGGDMVLVAAQLALASWMAAIAWYVGVVHYPSIRFWMRDEQFHEAHGEHSARTTILVAPAMVVEGVLAALLVLDRPAGVPAWAAAAGLALWAVTWAATFGLSVPAHRGLEGGWSTAAHRRLVRTNTVRAVAWSARVLLLGWVAVQVAA